MDTVYPQPIRLRLETTRRRNRASQDRYRTQPVTFSEIKVSINPYQRDCKKYYNQILATFISIRLYLSYYYKAMANYFSALKILTQDILK